MKKSTYSQSPYGQMRDRIETIRKEQKEKQKRKEEDYYTWLVSGK